MWPMGPKIQPSILYRAERGGFRQGMSVFQGGGNFMDVFLQGFATVLQPQYLLFMFGGVALGLFIGFLPGLSGGMGIGLMLPFTSTWSP